jgi:hypothetical protein
MEPAYTWITSGIAIGTGRAAECIKRLQEDRVQVLIDLRSEARDNEKLLRKAAIDFLHLPTPDHHAVSQEMLWKGVEFARSYVIAERKVLIHCEHGIGRSALLVCCVMVSLGHSPLSALLCLKNAREVVSPSPDQLHALLEWSRSWDVHKAELSPPVTWDDLAAVAYRHLKRSS